MKLLPEFPLPVKLPQAQGFIPTTQVGPLFTKQRVFITAGQHDWPTWKRLWDQFLVMHGSPLLRVPEDQAQGETNGSIALEFDLICIATNKPLIPNYGGQYRNGETISTAFVESVVNQVVRASTYLRI
jgi:hypothetical protein